MDDTEVIKYMGRQVDITWEGETGPQEAGGIFVGISDDGYVILDWGYGVSERAKGFTINAAK
jgi:hypothetical protein